MSAIGQITDGNLRAAALKHTVQIPVDRDRLASRDQWRNAEGLRLHVREGHVDFIWLREVDR